MAECKLVTLETFSDTGFAHQNFRGPDGTTIMITEDPLIAAQVKAYLDAGWQIKGSYVGTNRLALLLIR